MGNQQKSKSNKLPLLSIQNITKSFGYKKVLKGVSFDLFAGQITLLAGRNGAGKSTLIKILAGLMRPSKGHIHFENSPLDEVAHAYRDSFGLITHQTLFYNDLTAKENLLFFGKLRKIKNVKAKVKRVLVKTGLQKATDLQVKAFSSGMGKRLNIARIMMSEPSILFLDEPYSGLDLDSIAMLNDYLDSFKQQGGAVLLISHQIDACYDRCDQVALLIDGYVQQIIPTSDLNQEDLQRRFQSEQPETIIE
jgi:heme ABC exporter ATP-binding subunit CcmA